MKKALITAINCLRWLVFGRIFATETRKRLAENFNPSIDNAIIILYIIQNLNRTKPKVLSGDVIC